MALQPFTNEQLNYFKFAFIVLNEIPKTLRQTFKQMWDNTFASLPGFQPWDDSNAVRTLFLSTEGGITKVPTHLSYDEWDCSALFQATIYARSFALPDSKGHHRTLHDLYLKSHKLPHGAFHSSVVSPSGDNAETFALAIDQLRLLRNSFCHSFSSEIDKKTFDQYVQHAKDAIKALGVNTDPIDAVGSLTESDFPTEKVQRLEDDIRKELQTESTFLKEEVKDELTGIRSDIAHLNQKRQEEAKLLQESHKEDTADLKKTIETTNATSQEMINEKFAEFQTESTVLKEDVKDELVGIRSDITQLKQNQKEEAKFLHESHKEDTLDLKKTVAASQEMMTEKIAEVNQKIKDILKEDSSGKQKIKTSF